MQLVVSILLDFPTAALYNHKSLKQGSYSTYSLTRKYVRSSNIFEFFRASLCTDYLSNLHKMFQVASIYNTNVEFQI